MLTITLDEELSAKITDAVAIRGEEASEIALNILRHACEEPRQPTPAKPLMTMEEFIATLEPVWAEQERRRAGGILPEERGRPGDIYEEKLRQYYGEDYDREQGRTP